jgi:hypothetical protein
MTFINQRHKTDCGIAALAMLCGKTYEEANRAIPWRKHGCMYGTDTKMLVAGAKKLGYIGHGTATGQLKRITRPVQGSRFRSEDELNRDYFAVIPENSLVKVPNPNGYGEWHWVVWRNNKVYCPTKGIFKAEKYGARPSAYMQFKREVD